MSIAFVTGGTGSVGRAIVLALSSAGYEVHFQYHRNEKVAAELVDLTGASKWSIEFDVASVAIPDLKADVLVNTAGVNVSSAWAAEYDDADWEYTLRVNLTAPCAFIRRFLPHMISSGGGSIININSIYGIRSVEGNLAYTASKHALSGVTKTVAREYGAAGIRCNEICPGPVESNMMDEIAARRRPGEPESYLDEIRQKIPSRSLATPTAIAATCSFLLSDGGRQLNGASIVVDGGMIA